MRGNMNSARALGETLERLYKDRPNNEQLVGRWAELLGTQPYSSDYHFALAAMQARAEAVVREIGTCSANERAKKQYVNAVSSLLPYFTAHTVTGQKISALNALQNQIDMLFMAADSLADKLVPEINPLTIEALRSNLEEVRENTGKADISAELKLLIVSQINRLISILSSYDILGPDAAASIFGSAAATLGRLDHDQSAKGPKEKGILKKALDVCKKVGAGVIFASAVVGGATDLLEDGRTLLGIESDTESNSDG